MHWSSFRAAQPNASTDFPRALYDILLSAIFTGAATESREGEEAIAQPLGQSSRSHLRYGWGLPLAERAHVHALQPPPVNPCSDQRSRHSQPLSARQFCLRLEKLHAFVTAGHIRCGLCGVDQIDAVSGRLRRPVATLAAEAAGPGVNLKDARHMPPMCGGQWAIRVEPLRENPTSLELISSEVPLPAGPRARQLNSSAKRQR